MRLNCARETTTLSVKSARMAGSRVSAFAQGSQVSSQETMSRGSGRSSQCVVPSLHSIGCSDSFSWRKALRKPIHNLTLKRGSVEGFERGLQHVVACRADIWVWSKLNRQSGMRTDDMNEDDFSAVDPSWEGCTKCDLRLREIIKSAMISHDGSSH